MAQNESVHAASAAAGALVIAAMQAGIPIAIGMVCVGLLGAGVAHARAISAREKDGEEVFTRRQHLCMLLRGILFAEFVCMIIFITWIEYNWPWTLALILGAISSVFASEAIELMWSGVRHKFKRFTGIERGQG